jgi:hypothetical protein
VRRAPHRPGALTAALLAVVLTACSASTGPRAAPSTSASPTTPAAGPVATPSPRPAPDVPTAVAVGPLGALPCPSAYADPRPLRPVVSAALTVDGRAVTGTQRIVFTPDLPVDALVFRLWAAGPRSRSAGAAVEVPRVVVDGVERAAERAAPTLLRVPLPGGRPAGRAIEIEMAFALRLPVGTNDRLGARGETSWVGSGLPLLAWEHGRGWAEQPETANFAEATSSEVMDLRSLAVTRRPGLARWRPVSWCPTTAGRRPTGRRRCATCSSPSAGSARRP